MQRGERKNTNLPLCGSTFPSMPSSCRRWWWCVWWFFNPSNGIATNSKSSDAIANDRTKASVPIALLAVAILNGVCGAGICSRPTIGQLSQKLSRARASLRQVWLCTASSHGVYGCRFQNGHKHKTVLRSLHPSRSSSPRDVERHFWFGHGIGLTTRTL